MPRVITLDELRARLEGDDPVTLVEALPPMYYEAEHLPGAINVPHDEVDALAPALLPDRAGLLRRERLPRGEGRVDRRRAAGRDRRRRRGRRALRVMLGC